MTHAPAAPPRSAGDGFPLVADALGAKLRLTYLARQDILWTGPADGDVSQVVVDIARAGRRARMSYRFPPEAAGRVMVDDGANGYLYDPRRRELLVGQSSSDDETAAAPVTLALLRRNYCCQCLRCEVVGGQKCHVVSIRPCRGDGATKLCWIDGVHHAVLRTEEYDALGRRRYVSFYEAIRFCPSLPAASLSLPAAAKAAPMRRLSVQTMDAQGSARAFAAAGVAGRLPAWCPRGYLLLHCAVVCTQPGVKAVLLHYCDGLKTITVLEESRGASAPRQADLNRSLARYGQRAWVRDDGALRVVVRGDLSLPPAQGEEMRAALSPQADPVVARQLVRDFGPQAARRAAGLRRRGWGYEQIGALSLWQRSHPRSAPRLESLLARSLNWIEITDALGADAEALDARARAWIAAALTHP